MRYSELVRELKRQGVRLIELRKRHEMWGWEWEGKVRTTSVPRHRSQEVSAGTLAGILRDLGITREEWERA